MTLPQAYRIFRSPWGYSRSELEQALAILRWGMKPGELKKRDYSL